MSDNKIKKGQSTWFDNFCSYWVTNHNNAPIAITCDKTYEDAEETANKLVSAYNATYGNGINPEAVSDLLGALQGMLEPFSHIGCVGHASKLNAMNAAKAAIDKAKTQPQ